MNNNDSSVAVLHEMNKNLTYLAMKKKKKINHAASRTPDQARCLWD